MGMRSVEVRSRGADSASVQENRIALCVDIDPGWCDVVVQRWEALTGGKAKKT
jgi:hypothetical protein